MLDLERAIQIAVQAHAGQKDRAGEPYILHPLRVMMACRTPAAKIVGILHDVVEDTSVTFEQLQAEGMAPEVLAALRLVTHEEGVPYEAYIDGALTNPVAAEVKIADLEDNTNVRRMEELNEKTVVRLRRYLAAYRRLTAQRDGRPA